MEKVFTTIILVTTVQALIYTGIFIAVKNNRSLKLLGLFMFVYIGTNLQWIFKDNVKYLPTTFSYLVVPLFYLYIRSILGIARKRDLWHLVPAAVEFLGLLPMLLSPGLGDAFYHSGKYNTFIIIFLVYIPPVYNLLYTGLSLLALKKCRKSISLLYTDVEKQRLNWLYVTCIIFATLYGLNLITSTALLTTSLDSYIYLYESVASAFIVYWTSVYGLNQKNLMLGDSRTETDNTAETGKVYVQGEAPPGESYEQKHREIIAFFEKTKIYTNKEISLFMVADLLQMPYKEVSKSINLVARKNFNQFVNEFRVKEAKELIKSDRLDQFTLTALAEEGGFNSRSTFFFSVQIY
ncbi:hypothetical protein CHU92_09410 [Flavobacterium cyanobacteriorum]|uniref:HTH araC/xylS-type domain-containing protein n=1 Tax=Flavobacterium cyanobacteriorum TaxID=2022802 RepID=A0A255Z764_9FLAO|nr:helix-turn-helix transcriptional regulator [Flavobacterium cyanobacteriorum]OYQ36735.1 hypothetical protein CHU92_09410 [Flavobacterium cyanobacteriorum]